MIIVWQCHIISAAVKLWISGKRLVLRKRQITLYSLLYKLTFPLYKLIFWLGMRRQITFLSVLHFPQAWHIKRKSWIQAAKYHHFSPHYLSILRLSLFQLSVSPLVSKGQLSQHYLFPFLLHEDHYPISWALVLLFLPLTASGCSECFLSHFSIHSLSCFKVVKYISCYFWYSVSSQYNFSSPGSHSSLFGLCCEAQSECRATIFLSRLWPKLLWNHSRLGLAIWHISQMRVSISMNSVRLYK